jgi:AraC-like DNA-binding protein
VEDDCTILQIFQLIDSKITGEVSMDMINHPLSERETQRMQDNREELVDRIGRIVRVDGSAQPLEGLYLYRSSVSRVPVHGIAEPSFCVIAQGSKEVLVGNHSFRYDPFNYLISTVELPRVSQILEASKVRPYLSFRLEFAPTLIDSVLVEAGHSLPRGDIDVRAIDVSPLDLGLQDAVVRLVRLVDSPAEAPVLMPLIIREIIYRLLMGKQGARLRHLAIQRGYTPHIAKAVERLRQDLDQPLHIENLARELGMSVSGLHHHFKAVTELSPLQFQKHLRLQEARRLMLSEDLDAENAAYRVGYHDASHFNRDYKSLFGIPPMRDVHRLREEVLVSADR